MARIGNALRGLSVTGQSASTLLYWLNRLVCSDESPEQVASAAVLVFDQDRPMLHWAQAGHPPPVLVSGGVARLLAQPSGLLLGTVPTAQYDFGGGKICGDVLFLYTDGLIERRDRDIDAGLTAPCSPPQAASRARPPTKRSLRCSTASTRRSPKTICACSPSASGGPQGSGQAVLYAWRRDPGAVRVPARETRGRLSRAGVPGQVGQERVQAGAGRSSSGPFGLNNQG